MNRKASSCDQCGNLLQDLLVWRNIDVPVLVLQVSLFLQLLFQLLKKCCTGHGVTRERSQFKLQKSCEALEGNVLQFTVNMKEAKASEHNLKGYDGHLIVRYK